MLLHARSQQQSYYPSCSRPPSLFLLHAPCHTPAHTATCYLNSDSETCGDGFCGQMVLSFQGSLHLVQGAYIETDDGQQLWRQPGKAGLLKKLKESSLGQRIADKHPNAIKPPAPGDAKNQAPGSDTEYYLGAALVVTGPVQVRKWLAQCCRCHLHTVCNIHARQSVGLRLQQLPCLCSNCQCWRRSHLACLKLTPNNLCHPRVTTLLNPGHCHQPQLRVDPRHAAVGRRLRHHRWHSGQQPTHRRLRVHPPHLRAHTHIQQQPLQV